LIKAIIVHHCIQHLISASKQRLLSRQRQQSINCHLPNTIVSIQLISSNISISIDMGSTSKGFQDKRVVVVGGGLGGMAFMNAAMYAGLKNVQCYEQAHQFGEVGAGVDVSANANRILDAFGLQDSLLRRSSPQLPYYMQYHNYKTGEYLAHIEEFSKPHARLIHRAHLLDSLKERVPEERLHLQKRLASIDRNTSPDAAPYTLHFEDGTAVDADIVIGCDGIKSRVRRELGFGDSPNYSGQVVYRGFVEYKDLPEETSQLLRKVVNFRGPKRHILCLPIGNPATQTDRIGVIGFMSESLDSWDSENWMARADIETLHEHVKDWCPQVQDLIKGLHKGSPDGRMMKQALYVRDPLAKWFEMKEGQNNAGIVLLGDAVHSTLPHQGKSSANTSYSPRILFTKTIYQARVSAWPSSLVLHWPPFLHTGRMMICMLHFNSIRICASPALIESRRPALRLASWLAPMTLIT
jgi:salicylate hydroxylase